MKSCLPDGFPPPTITSNGWPWVQVHSSERPNLPKNDLPLISIVTPSFNQGRYIEATIRSVLLQGYPRLEYIIVDGGSTDGTLDIIRKYDPWLSYWVSEKDEGQAHAINKGFARAKGEIFAWLNSDDMYCPGALVSVARAFIENPGFDLVYGDCKVVDSQGRVIDYIKGGSGNLVEIMAQDFIPQPSAFFTARVWNDVGGLNTDLQYILDFDLWIRMMLRRIRSLYVPKALSFFRRHRASKSSMEVVRFGYEYLRLLDDLIKETADEDLRRSRLKGYHHAFSIIASGYEQLSVQSKDQNAKVWRFLEQWRGHLAENAKEYAKVPALLSESLYRIGQSYCLYGQVKQGRKLFVSAIRVKKSSYKAIVGWLCALLGSKGYKGIMWMWRAAYRFGHWLAWKRWALQQGSEGNG